MIASVQTHKGLALGIAALLSFVAPIQPLLLCAIGFISLDLLTSIIYNVRLALLKKNALYLYKIGIGNKLIHLIYATLILIMVYCIDLYILTPLDNLELTKLVAAIICFSEFFSITKKVASMTHSKAYKEINKLMNVKKHYLFTK
jgi:energy-coupling factor transporter transmembrane protein EcfT